MWCESEGGCIVPYRHQLQHGHSFSSLLLSFLFCLLKPKNQTWLRCDFIKDELCKQTGERDRARESKSLVKSKENTSEGGRGASVRQREEIMK